jgi:hypothetical protein
MASVLALWTVRGSAQGTDEDAAAVTRPLPWAFSIVYAQSFDDNPLFAPAAPLALPVAPDPLLPGGSWNGRLFSALSHHHHGPRSDVVLGGRAEGWVGQDPARHDRLSWSAGGTAGFDLTPRLRATVREDFQTAYTDEAAVLAGQGVVLPTALAHTNLATAVLAWRAGPYTTMTAEARHDYVDFVPQGALVGYSHLRGRLEAARRMGPRDTLSLSAAVEEWRAAGRVSPGLLVGPGWEHGFGARLRTRLSGGVDAFEALVDGRRRLEPFGVAALEGRFRRTTLDLSYSHQVAAGYQDGEDDIADLVTLGAARDFGRRVSLFLAGTGGRRRGLDTASLSTDTVSTTAGMSVRLSRRLEARLTHTFEHSRERGGLDPALVRRRQRVDVSLGYRRQW